MPTYIFLNKNDGNEFQEFMSISERDRYLEENPHITQLVNGAPMIVSGVPRKPDNGFRDLLKDMKKNHSKGTTGSTINTF